MGAGKIPTRWPRGMKEAYEEQYGQALTDAMKLKDVVAAILKRHPALYGLEKGKLDWANLQYEEAECFIAALEGCFSSWVPALSIHDSLIVRRSDQEMAKQILLREYQKRFGSRPQVKISME